jgi:hypothetical protein
MTNNIATAHSKWEQSRNPQWTKPKPGDLVLVRDIQKDKQHGKKLDSRWMGPRLLTQLHSPVTGYVQNIYGDGKTKKYHLDHLKVYCPRSDRINLTQFPQNDPYELEPNAIYTIASATTIASFSIDKTAMQMAGKPGSRFLDLNNPYNF